MHDRVKKGEDAAIGRDVAGITYRTTSGHHCLGGAT
jgi:hypothetical protein